MYRTLTISKQEPSHTYSAETNHKLGRNPEGANLDPASTIAGPAMVHLCSHDWVPFLIGTQRGRLGANSTWHPAPPRGGQCATECRSTLVPSQSGSPTLIIMQVKRGRIVGEHYTRWCRAGPHAAGLSKNDWAAEPGQNSHPTGMALRNGHEHYSAFHANIKHTILESRSNDTRMVALSQTKNTRKKFGKATR